MSYDIWFNLREYRLATTILSEKLLNLSLLTANSLLKYSNVTSCNFVAKKKKERNIRNWPKNFEQSRKFQPPAVISSWIFNTKLNDTNICPTNSFYMLNEIFSDDIRDIASRKWKKSGKTKGRIFFRRNQGNDMCTASFLDVRNRTPLDFSIGFVHYVFQSRFFLNKGQWK